MTAASPPGGARRPRRPAARSCCAAQPHRPRRCGPGSRAQDFVEVETADPAGLARQRGASARLRHRRCMAPDGDARAALPAHLAGIRLKKLLAAGEPRIFTLARVFRNRERGAAAPSRVHHAGMVPRRRALRAADGRLRGPAALAAEADGRRGAGAGAGRDGRSLRRARAADAWPRPSTATPASTCWRRSPDGRAGSRRAWPAAAARPGVRVAADDNWSDVFSRILVERIEPHLGIGRPTILDRYPARRGGAGPALRRRPARRRAVRALCLRRRARQRLRRTDRRRRAAPPLRGRDGASASALYGERYPIDEDFLAALAVDAAGERHRARLRPAGHAGRPAPTRIEQVLWTPVVGSG